MHKLKVGLPLTFSNLLRFSLLGRFLGSSHVSKKQVVHGSLRSSKDRESWFSLNLSLGFYVCFPAMCFFGGSGG